MATISTIPTVVDVNHYGGDTFSVQIKAPPEVTDGQEWNAVLKSSRETDVIDATFNISPPPLGGGIAYVYLSAVDCTRLVQDAPVITRRSPSGALQSFKKYVGVWDCQVNHPINSDPVRTLVQGTFTIEIDVTRLV